MVNQAPAPELDARFSSDDAVPTPWAEAQARLENAAVYWLSTVRPDGRPHVTPLIAVWLDDALHFCTGPGERKAKNLEHNARITITTGCNALDEGLDLVVEGDAVAVRDEGTLQRLADRYAEKYEGWHFTVRDGAFEGDGGRALVFQIAPKTVFAFGKGDQFSQTRWRFEGETVK